MKNYTKEKCLELLRKIDCANCKTFTYLNKTYQEFIFKLSEMVDLLCPSIISRLRANTKAWIDSEKISAIHKRNKLFKKYKMVSAKTNIIFDRQKWLFKKLYLRKKKIFLKEKIEKNAINSKKLLKLLNA